MAKLWYKGAYENGLVTSVVNKLYKRETIIDERFTYNIFEDDDWIGKILSKANNIICIDEFLYIYTQNNESLSHQVFSDETIKFLDILKKRMELFAGDEYIYFETEKLFCNVYIEYYLKAKNNKIDFNIDKDIFANFAKELQNSRKISKKTYIRYLIFKISPIFYKFLLRSMRKQ